MFSAMAKLFLVFLLCALTSAQNPSQHQSSAVSSTLSRTSTLRGGETNLASYVSHTGAVRGGSDGSQGYTHQQALLGTTNPQTRTGTDNGLSDNEVNHLTAEGNRRRLHSLYYNQLNRGRKVYPKRYNSLSLTRPYSLHPLLGRSQEADPNSADNSGANRDGSDQVVGSDSSVAGQDPEGSRRFYFPNDYNNPFNPYASNDNPFDPYAQLNAKNYLEAFGQYGNYDYLN